ncbi:MAG: hypothetical protein EA396_10680 [Anaerolineaceae bacterium]|nr:MAG: hypothetical protein EA396_10680 [Anaerolineaceae bacterium]
MFTKNALKSFTSIVIWGLCTLIAIVAIGTSGAGESGWTVVIALIAAMMSTLFIWSDDSGNASASNKKSAEAAKAGKSKRGANNPQAEKMHLLMELMSEDEQQAFKEALKAQVLRDSRHLVDGELPYDAELFDPKEFDAPDKRLRGE